MFRLLSRRIVTRQSVRSTSTSTSTRSVYTPLLTRSFSSLPSNVSSSFLSGESSAYIDEMYHNWRENPSSVHASWDAYFRTGAYAAPPVLVEDYHSKGTSTGPRYDTTRVTTSAGPNLDTAKVVQLVRAFQVRGHLMANIDPLGLMPPRTDHEDLKLETYGFTDADLDRVIDLSGLAADMKGFLDKGRGATTLRQIYTRLRETYCTNIGYEYMHIPSVEKCNWIREKIETRHLITFTREQKLKLLDRLTWADHFEQFLARKFASAKRFGLEGAESTIPGMKALIGKSAQLGVDAIIIGMPHRGRLNVLSTVVRKPMEQILHEFEGGESNEEDSAIGSGDVKYHLGMSHDRASGPHNKMIHLSLLANPSHLEAVNPVVLGKAKAKQHYQNDSSQSKVMGLLLHGDAAFAGQGVVYETFAMGDLPNYTTGGTIHIVVNNQIGFTTDPKDARSTPYCTDIAKSMNAPIFHVNGDDPEAVVVVCELAAEWRAKFKKDVVIDLVCYRRHGHNEIDEPSFTQPHMYQKIKQQPSTLQKYQQQLLSEGDYAADIKRVSDHVNAFLERAFEASKKYKPKVSDWLASNWVGLIGSNKYAPPKITGVDVDELRSVGLRAASYPSDFTIHPRLKNVFDKKVEAIKHGKGIDWGTAEQLAFGTLLLEGKHVRLSGQDVERGTFSHRHAVLHDQKIKGRRHVSLQQLSPKQAAFTVCNSPLSEFGVLGFELGYSLEHPQSLVLWEAQFGDFFNGAQIIVDQFLSSGEAKWWRQTGLVMLLPHGYEGQGPEHSSARIERFLQQSNDHPDQIPAAVNGRPIQQSNWQIVNCSTPANYFHVLRRQIHREFRKPLVVFSPKSLLRSPDATSTIEEMGPGTTFKWIYPDMSNIQDGNKVKRMILCSGKVYYDLAKKRTDVKADNVAIIRVEQVSPFPFHQVAAEAKKYPNADIMWVQEEPMNMGSFTYVKPRIVSALKQLNNKDVDVLYAGRAPSASPAAGHHTTHTKELAAFLEAAFTLKP